MATLNYNVIKNPFVGQNLRGTVGRYTGPASYVAAGDSLRPQELKLGQIAALIFEPAINAAGTIRLLVYDIANETVQWYVPNTGSEVADATDLSGFNARFSAFGS